MMIYDDVHNIVIVYNKYCDPIGHSEAQGFIILSNAKWTSGPPTDQSDFLLTLPYNTLQYLTIPYNNTYFTLYILEYSL